MTDTEILAAEYVLGLIRGDERANVIRRISQDDELRYWVNWWEQRFFPLVAHPKPQQPRKQVWEQLQRRLNPPADKRAQGQNPWLRGWFSAAAGLALVVITVISVRVVDTQLTPQKMVPTHYASLESNGMLSHVIERYGDNHLQIIAVRPVMTAPQKALELWALVDNTAPMSLGMLPNDGSLLVKAPARLNKLDGNITLAVSVEPAGGSPTGLPTGPVVNTTTLVHRNKAQQLSF